MKIKVPRTIEIHTFTIKCSSCTAIEGEGHEPQSFGL